MLKYCFSISLEGFSSITEADQDLMIVGTWTHAKFHRGPTVPVKVLHYNEAKQNPAHITGCSSQQNQKVPRVKCPSKRHLVVKPNVRK